MIGRWPAPKVRASTCIPQARPILLRGMARLAALHLRPKAETVLCTIRRIPYLRVAEAFAATTIIWLRAHSISVLTKIEMMYWSTPRPSFKATWRSRARSRSSLCQLIRSGHGPHGQASRCSAGRILSEFNRWNLAGALPQLPGETRTHAGGKYLQVHYRRLGHQQCLFGRTSLAPGNFQQ